MFTVLLSPFPNHSEYCQGLTVEEMLQWNTDSNSRDAGFMTLHMVILLHFCCMSHLSTIFTPAARAQPHVEPSRLQLQVNNLVAVCSRQAGDSGNTKLCSGIISGHRFCSGKVIHHDETHKASALFIREMDIPVHMSSAGHTSNQIQVRWKGRMILQ